jgi:hypothetical protein
MVPRDLVKVSVFADQSTNNSIVSMDLESTDEAALQ